MNYSRKTLEGRSATFRVHVFLEASIAARFFFEPSREENPLEAPFFFSLMFFFF